MASSDWKHFLSLSEVGQRQPGLQKMVAKVATVRTMAFQSWMNKSLADLGWRDQSPVMDAYVEPMNTWADMSQLIVRENWPASSNIRNIAYFCGPMEGWIPLKTDEPEIGMVTVQEASNHFPYSSYYGWRSNGRRPQV